MQTNNKTVPAWLHILIIVVGAVILACLMSHSHVWFDEAYSVAMAQHSFQDIWVIGATDVHPVLYYWLLHCLDLVFGPNIILFHLFSAAGTVVLSILGYTHIRKDFGARCGFIFSILVYLIPWSLQIASQIRMYSWLIVVVMLSSIYAWRIVKECGKTSLAIPAHWWVILTTGSLIAAYLHYYGAISSFVIQLVVLVAFIRSKAANKKRCLIIWSLCALGVVLLYLPWLICAFGQVNRVSSGFWISIELPWTFVELVLYPFFVLQPSALDGNLGDSLFVYSCLALIAIEIACAYELGRLNARDTDADSDGSPSNIRPLLFFVVIYLGTGLIAAFASIAIHQPILYYRYMSAALGPVIFVIAYTLSLLKGRKVVIVAWLLIMTFSIIFYVDVIYRNLVPENETTTDAYYQMYQETQTLNADKPPLVLSGDEGLGSIIAVETEGAPIIYTDPQYKYKAFEPRFIIDDHWEDILDSYDGYALYIGTKDAAESLAQEYDGKVIETKGYYHPYSARWIEYTILDFDR